MTPTPSQLVGDVKSGNSLVCGDHILVEFPVLEDMDKERNKVRFLNFRKEKFQVFKELDNKIPWKTALRDREQDSVGRSLRCKKSDKRGESSTWLSQT